MQQDFQEYKTLQKSYAVGKPQQCSSKDGKENGSQEAYDKPFQSGVETKGGGTQDLLLVILAAQDPGQLLHGPVPSCCLATHSLGARAPTGNPQLEPEPQSQLSFFLFSFYKQVSIWSSAEAREESEV
jgi:hypothetical protein